MKSKLVGIAGEDGNIRKVEDDRKWYFDDKEGIMRVEKEPYKYKFDTYEEMIKSDAYKRMSNPQCFEDYGIACSFKAKADPTDWKAVYGEVKRG